MTKDERKTLEELNDTLLNVLSLNIAICDKLELIEEWLGGTEDQNRLVHPKQLIMIERDHIVKAGEAVDDLIGDDKAD